MVLGNDTDLDINKAASALKVVAVSSGDNEDQSAKGGIAKAVNNGGYVLYTPPAGFPGVDSFSYIAVDTVGQICSADATATQPTPHPRHHRPGRPDPPRMQRRRRDGTTVRVDHHDHPSHGGPGGPGRDDDDRCSHPDRR